MIEPVFGPGDEGPEIVWLQTRLHSPLSGVFDDELASRVRGFQLAAGIRVTGVVDQDTVDELGMEPWTLTRRRV